MAGQIRRMIDRIVEERSNGNATLANITLTKLILKGVRVDDYHAASADDPAVMQQVRAIGADLGVTV